MNNTALNLEYQEARPELDWLTKGETKEYRVTARSNGDKLEYGQYNTVAECEQAIKALKTPSERWMEGERYVHPYFGCTLDEVFFSIELTDSPSDEELMAEFAETNLFS